MKQKRCRMERTEACVGENDGVVIENPLIMVEIDDEIGRLGQV